MKPNESGSKLLQGAFILSAAAIVSKLIGTLQKIPLQNMGGDAVFGIYNTVYPLYTMIITIAIAGFPAALSKYVAEYEAAGRREESRRMVRISTAALVIFGLVLGVAMYLGAPVLGAWIGDEHVVPALRSGAIALAFVPWMALLRGYFQGLHNMVPTAVSQIVEQSIRVAVMIGLLLYMIQAGAGVDEIAAGALFGSAAGGAAGLLVMAVYWHKETSSHRRTKSAGADAKAESGTLSGSTVPSQQAAGPLPEREGSGQMLRRLTVYALPICLSALAVPLIGLVDTFTVPRLLKSTGLSGESVMAQFGIYNRGLPLVQLVTMMATSLSVLFIPALAETKFKGQGDLVANQCRMALRWFWLLGLAASFGLAILAVPINIMLYQDTVGSTVMRWVAFTAVGGTLSIISAALLQGIGRVKAPAVHLLVGALLKLGLNLLLVPKLGITGAAIAGVAAHFTAAILNVFLLARTVGFKLNAVDLLLKPAVVITGLTLAAWAMSGAVSGMFTVLGNGSGRLGAAAASLAGVTAGGAVFLAGTVLVKLLTEEELRMLPKVGGPLADMLKAIRILR
ncbi:putative polysaccharide biosynthesis protein [Paenibacillus dakarensis]|uniref:putative polysaccharide biosynthesis protein n=1 Tax=Paenibacillus dakarensis TaxID=1527293 RepID=UPI0006D5921D|nr:polysaccharide biosynthesis protein [Paenibacillus dakarensis]